MSTNETMILDLSKATPAELAAMTAKCDAAIRTMTQPETMFGEPTALAKAIGEHYAGGPDGPIREPGDDVPSRSDMFSDDELTSMCELHVAQLARLGYYHIATDVGLLIGAFEAKCSEVDEARDVVQMLVARLEAAGLGSCTKDVRCLLGDHAGACVFSVAERDQVRRDDREADDHE